VALLDDQLNVELPPLSTLSGLAWSLTVGAVPAAAGCGMAATASVASAMKLSNSCHDFCAECARSSSLAWLSLRAESGRRR
jgi:hypothetical protein